MLQLLLLRFEQMLGQTAIPSKRSKKRGRSEKEKNKLCKIHRRVGSKNKSLSSSVGTRHCKSSSAILKPNIGRKIKKAVSPLAVATQPSLDTLRSVFIGRYIVEPWFSSPIPGKIVSISQAVGEVVDEGDVLMVLEAMKMHQSIRSDLDGFVSKVMIEAGQQVKGGEIMFELSS